MTSNQEKVLRYLKEQIKSFSKNLIGKDKLFTCPSCLNKKPSAIFIGETDKITCLHCSAEISPVELVYIVEKDKRAFSKQDVIKYLAKCGIESSDLDLERYFAFYEKNRFDLVPLLKDQKIPFEQSWVQKEHKNKQEWRSWVDNQFNIGIKTGKISNITVIDIDTQDVPKELQKCSPVYQSTNKGFHYVFKYEEDLPSTRIVDLKIDILNDGRQFVAYPSNIEGIKRFWSFNDSNIEIPKMSPELKAYIKSKLTTKTKEKDIEQIDISKIDINNIAEGNRNNTLIKLGGILRKELNTKQTEYVLNIVNKNFVKPSLSSKEFYNLVNSLDKYIDGDERNLAIKILEYLRYAEEATSKDIEQAIGEKKAKVDKAISFLLKEKYVIRRGRLFQVIRKLEWKENFPALDTAVPFKVPYFYDIAHFCWQDLILLGGRTGTGKTIVAINIMKRLIEQGIKPNYICTETGGRFVKIACALGLKEGDFKWTFCSDPINIELEKDSVTILDWLMLEDKSKTDVIFKYLADQLFRSNALLFVFQQLKVSMDWFAPNMVDQYAAFATRYLYDDETGINGHWELDKIRDAKIKTRKGVIPCKYFWDRKELLRLDEINQTIVAQKPQPKESSMVNDKDLIEVNEESLL